MDPRNPYEVSLIGIAVRGLSSGNNSDMQPFLHYWLRCSTCSFFSTHFQTWASWVDPSLSFQGWTAELGLQVEQTWQGAGRLWISESCHGVQSRESCHGVIQANGYSGTFPVGRFESCVPTTRRYQRLMPSDLERQATKFGLCERVRELVHSGWYIWMLRHFQFVSLEKRIDIV